MIHYVRLLLILRCSITHPWDLKRNITLLYQAYYIHPNSRAGNLICDHPEEDTRLRSILHVPGHLHHPRKEGLTLPQAI